MNKIFYFVIFISISGCVTTKNVPDDPIVIRAREINKNLENAIQLTLAKANAGEMSVEESEKIKNAIGSKIKQNTESINAVKNIKSKKDKKKYLEKLDARIKVQLNTITVMSDLYELERFTAFNSAKFFKTGEFTIPKQSVAGILKDMEPLANAIIQFINVHTNQKLRVVMGVYGYSDEQAISAGGQLFKKLIPLMDKQNPSNDDLNQKLSELRAKSLAIIIQEMMIQKQTTNSNLSMIKFEINWIGRGTKLPGNIANPKIDDERRRVVTFIWNVYAEDLFTD